MAGAAETFSPPRGALRKRRAGTAIRGFVVHCKRLGRMVFLWVDRDRAELPRERMERHLEGCPTCRQRVVEVERVVLTLRSCCPRERVPARLVDRIRIRIEAE